MRKFLLGIALLLCISASAQQVERQIKGSNGQLIGFYEFKPSDYRAKGEGHPVIIFLHGIGERGDGDKQLKRVIKNGLPENIKKGETMRFYVNGKWESFIVLSPQLSTRYGSWQNFYVEEMIEYAEKKLNIDRNRIYLTGLSLGGGGVWEFASASVSNATKLAAIAPICGTCRMKNGSNIADAELPVWAFHAENDDIVRVSCTENAIAEIKSKKPKVNPKATIWKDGKHGVWERVYNKKAGFIKPSIFEWFLEHSRSGAVANKKPVAKVPENLTVSASLGKIKVDASESYDPDGQIVSYNWKKISGPSTGILGNLLSSVFEITGLTTAGKYEYELTVTDNKGASDAARVSINVTEEEAKNKAPKADAGNDISLVLPDNKASLSGKNSSDEDGDIKAYQWTKSSGPSSYTIVSPQEAETDLKDLEEGTYKFTLEVKDDKGETATDEITVIVRSSPNKAPKAKAGSDITITLPENSVTLSGQDSEDEDGRIVSYRWTKVKGGSAEIQNDSDASTKVEGLTEGSYTFKLTVTDDKDESASAEINVTVKGKANAAPKAVAGDDQSIQLPKKEVTLNGSKSSDEDGKIVKHAWTKVDGGSASIENPDDASTTVSNLEEGSYTFKLTVTDDQNESSSAEVKVTVKKAAANQAPVVKIEGDSKIKLPQTEIKLSGKKSSDEDGTIKQYSWSKVSGPTAKIKSAGASETRITNLEAGNYVFKLTVKDNKNSSASANFELTVEPDDNKAPIAKAGGNKKIKLPANKVTLNGSSSTDPDGKIATYKWSKVKGSSAKITSPNKASTSITGLSKGTYVFKLEVTDNKKASSSDQVEVVVEGNENKAPIANGGGNKSIEAPASKVTLNGSKSTDSDGKIASYKWTKVSGPAARIATPSKATTEITGLVKGRYIFRLTVIDNDKASASDDVEVIVEGKANRAPVAVAGSGSTIELPGKGSLDGSKSSDPDGKIVSWLWMKVSGPSVKIESPSSAETAISELSAGTYKFRLTVTDEDNEQSSDEVTVTVKGKQDDQQFPDENNGNKAPKADAGSDRTIKAPAGSVIVDGIDSYDPDGRIVSWKWTQVSGPSALIFYPNSRGTSIRHMGIGTYRFRLTIKDNKGATSSDDMMVYVLDRNSEANLNTATAGTDVAAAEEVILPSTDKLTVFPNPVVSTMNVQLSSAVSGAGNITIYDVSGKVVKRIAFQKNQPVVLQNINTTDLKSGVYHLEVIVANSTKVVTKFIKK